MLDFDLSAGERLDFINEDLTIIQKKDGLTFGTDAYLLSAFVRKGTRGADLGAGTGVASLLCLTKGKLRHIFASEIQTDFSELCRRNAKLNSLEDRMTVIPGDVRELSPKLTDGELDTVISNPPYMKADSGFSNISGEMNIARREIHGTIGDFCAAASRLLKFGGLFYTVYRPDRMCDLICALRENCLEPKKLVTVFPDADSEPCLILTESKKGASPSLIFSKPLIIYKSGTRDYTEDMRKVYDTCSLSHIFR